MNIRISHERAGVAGRARVLAALEQVQARDLMGKGPEEQEERVALAGKEVRAAEAEERDAAEGAEALWAKYLNGVANGQASLSCAADRPCVVVVICVIFAWRSD